MQKWFGEISTKVFEKLFTDATLLVRLHFVLLTLYFRMCNTNHFQRKDNLLMMWRICMCGKNETKQKNIEHHVSNWKYLEDNKPVKLSLYLGVYVKVKYLRLQNSLLVKVSILLFHIWKLIWCRHFFCFCCKHTKL